MFVVGVVIKLFNQLKNVQLVEQFLNTLVVNVEVQKEIVLVKNVN